MRLERLKVCTLTQLRSSVTGQTLTPWWCWQIGAHFKLVMSSLTCWKVKKRIKVSPWWLHGDFDFQLTNCSIKWSFNAIVVEIRWLERITLYLHTRWHSHASFPGVAWRNLWIKPGLINNSWEMTAEPTCLQPWIPTARAALHPDTHPSSSFRALHKTQWR